MNRYKNIIVKYHSLSPHHYCGNEPVSRIDKEEFIKEFKNYGQEIINNLNE